MRREEYPTLKGFLESRERLTGKENSHKRKQCSGKESMYLGGKERPPGGEPISDHQSCSTTNYE